MGANGGGPSFIKKEEDFDSKCNDNNNNNKHHSIAERRAALNGFNASNLHATRFNTAVVPFTVPPGISPSALLDSPVLLPNVEAQLSPTTGTFQILSPNQESFKLKLKLSSDGEDATPMAICSDMQASDNFNKPLEEFECPRNFRQKECFDDNCRKEMIFEHQVKTEGSLLPNQNQQRNHHHHHQIQKTAPVPKEATKNSLDGFYWRKYGQKHVKGSEYPRSYYKCTNSNCTVTKKVERSHDGEITEIVYKGSHNHPQPQPLAGLNEVVEMGEAGGMCIKTEAKDVDFGGPDVLETSSSSVDEFSDDHISRSFQEFATDEASPESASFNGEDDESGGVYEAKRRKRESLCNETAMPRSAREPKVVVQIQSEIDILEDGYRWRKYGQKVVKGNPNPRSYYKCTSPGCPVRKHVERAANDIKSVLTTYEGKHNHEIPSSKNAVTDVNNTNPSHKSTDALKPTGYMDRKPIFNYRDLNFSASSVFPLPFPPFHYGYSSSYPMMPDYMSMPSPHLTASVPVGGTYHCTTSSYATHHQLQPPKEEQMTTEDELFHTCLSIPREEGNFGTLDY